jgi:hypothetical protein
LRFAFRVSHAAHGGLHLVDALEHLHGLFVEEPAVLREVGRAGAALDQRHAQLLLQLLDLPAQRRLCDVQALRGAGEAPFARHRDEVPEVPQLHTILSGYDFRPTWSWTSGKQAG